MEPERALAPFMATITVEVLPSAIPGVYQFAVNIHDETTAEQLGREPITLIVLSRGIPRHVARYLPKARSIYQRYGSQAAIWYLVKHILPGATFTQLKQPTS